MTDEPGKGDEGGGEAEDEVFLKKIESSMLTQVKLQGIEGIRKVREGRSGAGRGEGGCGVLDAGADHSTWKGYWGQLPRV